MATLYITEYARSDLQGLSHAQAAFVPAVAVQTVTISGVSAASAAFNNATGLVRLHTDAICSFVFGTTPTATTSNARMPADQTEYFAVSPGGAMKVAVITNT